MAIVFNVRPRGCARILLCATLLAGVLALPVRATPLDADTQAHIRGATFEVVVPKAENAAIVYEKPLPMELLPFKFRNDKYFSIGTAFALGPHRYVTAGHVFLAVVNNPGGVPALRDEAGKVYAVDEVVKFSVDEDFVVFTLKEEPKGAPLEAGPRPALHDAVSAVGNAYGQGVIIRDGVYTSELPEPINGRWNWMQFSAAASPGNSGGPLVNQDGKVIGVVLGGVQGDTFNRAVSIEQVLSAKDGVGLARLRTSQRLDVIDAVQTDDIDERIELPLSLPKYYEAINQRWDAIDDRVTGELLRNNAANIFPAGAGSHRQLERIESRTFPSLLIRQPDGGWDAREPGTIDKQDLSANGYLSHGTLKQEVLLRLRRPDDVPAEGFYRDPKVMMDLLLKGYRLVRSMGPEPVRIISLGPAARDALYTDSYGRQWQVRQWSLPHEQRALVLYCLPVPDGYIAMLRLNPVYHLHEDLKELGALTSYVSVAYAGTLTQWHDFMSVKLPRPKLLSSVRLDVDTAKSVEYHSDRLALSLNSDVLSLSASSWLALDTGWFPEGDHVVWDVAQLSLREDVDSWNRLHVWRAHTPAPELDESVQSHWKKIVNRQHPFDTVLRVQDDHSFITRVLDTPSKPGDALDTVRYLVEVTRDGSVPPDVMAAKLDLAVKNVQVLER